MVSKSDFVKKCHLDPFASKPTTCNCWKKEDCPLPGKCTTNNVIYEAKVSTTNCNKTYIYRTHGQHLQNQIYCSQIKLHESRQGKQHRTQQIHLETKRQTDTLPNNLENTSTSTAIFTNNKTLQSLPLGKVSYYKSK